MPMHPHPFARIVAPILLVVTLTVLAALAPTPVHRSDNFDNNSLANFWTEGHFGNLRLREKNQRLEFRTVGPISLDAAGVAYTPYGINWKQDFHIEWDYRLNLTGNLTPVRWMMGTVLLLTGAWPESVTGVVCGLLREGNFLYIGILTFEDGALIDIDGVIVTQTSGRVEIDWDKSADRLTVSRGGQSTHVDGLFAMWGAEFGNSPMAMTQGFQVSNGSGITFTVTGSKAYMDNWEADFVKRLFP
jgi:hypothetical protein